MKVLIHMSFIMLNADIAKIGTDRYPLLTYSSHSAVIGICGDMYPVVMSLRRLSGMRTRMRDNMRST